MSVETEYWREKVEADQRYEHLAATVRIVISELCFLAESIRHDEHDEAERIYAVARVLEAQIGSQVAA